MIAKRIERRERRNDYRACARYVSGMSRGAGAKEKVSLRWFAGGEAEDFQESLLEVELTQAMNVKAVGSKTYHLVASFRPEDEPKLTEEVFKAIERRLAEALGLSGNQRHCGVHVNTRHIHLHAAYNLIDPETYKLKTPYYDFPKLSRACREIEKEFDLVADKGMTGARNLSEGGGVTGRAKTMEIRSGRESFFTFAFRQKEDIEADLATAADWAEIHAAFLKRGLRLKLSGAGLAVQDRFGRLAAKGSSLNRNWSKASLEKSYGSFLSCLPELEENITAQKKYTAAPLAAGPDTEKLYQNFQAERSRRQAALDETESTGRRAYEGWRAKWRLKRVELKRLPLLKPDRDKLRLELRRREKLELEQLRARTAESRKEIRQKFPCSTWKEFLKARQELAAPEAARPDTAKTAGPGVFL